MAARLTGELKTWHKTTLEFVSDVTFKEDTSTFRDYRLDVTFTHANTGKTITVPGFFAADGKAADSNATSGKIWQVNFNAPLDGKWSYDASFRTGNDIAASTAAKAGKAVGYIDGESGTFRIAETDKSGEDFRAKGMIVQDEGTHYLQHQGDGDYFVRGGPGIPENFLATSDIDNTVGTLDYKTHSSDFDKGGPTWDGGKGKNLIGAIDYLAEQGQNSIYLLTLTAAGDGKDVWPWAATDLGKLSKNASKLDPDITSVYDVSKLAQWEKIFDHMDEKGIFKNILLQEMENDQLLNGGTDVSGTSLSAERLIYMREMIARFGHNNGIQWNLGEENTNSTKERIDMAEWAKEIDPYDHLVVLHTLRDQYDSDFNPLLGVKDFDGPSFLATSAQIRDTVEEFRDKSEKAGDPWVLSWDEDSTKIIDANSNNPDSTSEKSLRDGLWGVLTAGGSGFSWYVKGSSGHSYDQNMDTFDAFDSVSTWTAAATKFYNSYIPFWDMKQDDGRTLNSGDYVMSDPGQYYVTYLPYGRADDVRLDLRGQSGDTFDIFWYNPRTGGKLIADGTVAGGSVVQVGGAPSATGKDWVLLARNSDLSDVPAQDDPIKPPPSEAATGSGFSATDDNATTAAGEEVSIHVLGNDDGAFAIKDFSDPSNGTVSRASGGKLIYTPDEGFSGTDSFTYVASDSDGDRDTATVTITVGKGSSDGNTNAPPPSEPDTGNRFSATDDNATTVAGEEISIHVLGNDDGAFAIKDFSDPSNGTVSRASGGKLIYTPDRGFDGTDSFTYVASDSDGVRDTATVTITVGEGNGGGNSPAPAPSSRYDIDAGGTGDSRFSGGETFTSSDPIAGTKQDALYQTERYGDFSYSMAVDNGTYDVTLKFAELYHDGAGARVFDVKAEGKTVLNDFDIWKAAGGDHNAHDVVVPVTVTDGMLDLKFLSVVNYAKLSGIEVAAAAKEADGNDSPAFKAPFDLSGPSLKMGDVFLFGFGVDGDAAVVRRSNGDIGVADVGSGTEVDYRKGSGSEVICFDLGEDGARGITLDLDGLNTVEGADEAAIFRTYGASGAELDEYLIRDDSAVTFDFGTSVRFASLEASPWIANGDLPSIEPDFSLTDFDVIA